MATRKSEPTALTARQLAAKAAAEKAAAEKFTDDVAVATANVEKAQADLTLAVAKAAQSPVPLSPIVKEFVLTRGKQGVFSHPSEQVARGIHAQCLVDDHKAGVQNAYALTERTVTYDGVKERPTGEDQPRVSGTITEREIVL